MVWQKFVPTYRSDINKSPVKDIAFRHYICSYNVNFVLSILKVIDQLACKLRCYQKLYGQMQKTTDNVLFDYWQGFVRVNRSALVCEMKMHCLSVHKLFTFLTTSSPEPIQVCSNEGPCPFLRGDKSKKCKIILKIFKNFPLQNHWANLNQTRHKASLDGGDSSLFKWRATPYSKGR